MTHKEWLDNEYSQWVNALQESTVHNFKEHPMVKRMLGEADSGLWFNSVEKPISKLAMKIDDIGRRDERPFTGTGLRFLYYAQQILKLNPSSICEIGGGVGQFYAILRALGYKGEYRIIDMLPVMHFQHKYLFEVEKQTGLNLKQCEVPIIYEMVVSFYAIGEFDDELKKRYFEGINNIKHGYIAWNAHSGATDDLSLFKHDIKVTEGIEPNIKIIQW